MILALDPGTKQTAYVLFHPTKQIIAAKGIEPNSEMRRILKLAGWFKTFAMEIMQSYGMPVGREVFNTCIWIGRFLEIAPSDVAFWPVYRKQVVAHHTGKAVGGDSAIRRAMLARFGSEKTSGVTYDVWSALAIATFVSDRIAAGLKPPQEAFAL